MYSNEKWTNKNRKTRFAGLDNIHTLLRKHSACMGENVCMRRLW